MLGVFVIAIGGYMLQVSICGRVLQCAIDGFELLVTTAGQVVQAAASAFVLQVAIGGHVLFFLQVAIGGQVPYVTIGGLLQGMAILLCGLFGLTSSHNCTVGQCGSHIGSSMQHLACQDGALTDEIAAV